MRNHQEWSRQRQFSVSNCGGLTLRREEEHGGSIVLDVYQIDGNDVWTLVSMASY